MCRNYGTLTGGCGSAAPRRTPSSKFVDEFLRKERAHYSSLNEYSRAAVQVSTLFVSCTVI